MSSRTEISLSEDQRSIMDRLNTFQGSVPPTVTKRKRNNKNNNDDDDCNYTSKNLDAERRRRKKLHSRFLALRSIVPIITNMNKASIVDDAITYIQKLQMKVESLSEMLHEMEAPDVEEEMELKPQVIMTDPQEECVEEDVHVSKIGESKYWLKIITAKRAGIFTKFIEVMNFIGFEINDITITTSNGTILVSSSVQGIHEGAVDVEQMKNFLMEAMRNA